MKRPPLWFPIVVAVCTASAAADVRRDIVFDCPCGAEWVAGAGGEPGTLTLVGGIRSLRTTGSGEIRIVAIPARRLWDDGPVPEGANSVSSGTLPAEQTRRGSWKLPLADLGSAGLVDLILYEQVAEGPNEDRKWHHHETLALWPAPGQDASETRLFVDILADSDGDGVGDVNEALAGTSHEDPESAPGVSTIDVLALYPVEFSECQNGYPHARMLHALTVADTIFQDSGTNIQLRIVGMAEVELDEYGQDARRDMHDELMETHGADVSVQYGQADSCGQNWGAAGVGASKSSRWYYSRALDMGGTPFVTAHELGHLMGLAHSSRQGESHGSFRWARGHYVTPRGTSLDETYSARGTIMTYGRRAWGGVFSSPSADCIEGPCGAPREAIDGADAVAALDLLRFQVAAHRRPATDTDGDGFIDVADALPNDPMDWFDFDGDGIGDNADPDDDNDQVKDTNDQFPFDPDEWADADLDGIGDNADDEVTDLNPFRDPELRAAVERALRKASGTAISEEDMSSLRVLDASRSNIRELTGLEQALRLEELHLFDNVITNVEPLAGLTNLHFLGLGGNQVADIGPLAGLTNLNHLYLNGNQVADIGPLAGLTNLNHLYLSDNRVADIGPLAGLTNLHFLGLGGNQVADIGPLAGLTNLNHLYLNGNQVADIGPLAGLTNLNHLYLSDNRVADIGPLAGLTNLNRLELRGNRVADIGPLAGLTNLNRLYLGDNRVADIGPLAGLTNLNNLYLSDNRVADIGPLAGLTNLNRLELGGNRVADIGPLAGLTRLEALDVSANPLVDLSALSGHGLWMLDVSHTAISLSDVFVLPHIGRVEDLRINGIGILDLQPFSELDGIRHLSLGDNEITDIGPLDGLVDLKSLQLNGNRVTDLEALSGMERLDSLNLSDNAITDLDPLVELASLRLLYLDGNPLNGDSVDTHIPGLRSRGVEVSFDPLAGLVAVPDPTLRAVIAHTTAFGGNLVYGMISTSRFRWLDELQLAGRGVANLAGLEAATSLERLYAAANRVEDLSPLAELPDITNLDLRNNRIADVSPLVANEALGVDDWVALEGNPLSEESLNTHVPALLGRGADVSVGAIGLTLLAAGGRLRFDTSGFFEAVLGKNTTLSVSVRDSNVADARMDAGALIVTPGDRTANTTVTVTGENGTDSRALTFVVTVRGPMTVPLVPNAMDPMREGFLRVVNHGREAAEARVAAIDDAGTRREGLTLEVGAGEAVHLNSSDLEAGNSDKGLTGGSGPGSGHWRLEIESTADLGVLSYIRAVGGFLTPMRNVVPVEPGVWDVPIFNPASNTDQVSSLRIANLGGELVEAVISGVDDDGRSPASIVRIDIPGGATRTFTAADLEDGSSGARGKLGDGIGKWRLRIESDGMLAVTNLLAGPEGHLTDLSTVPYTLLGGAGIHTVPLFPSAWDANGRQGLVRVVNRSEIDGDVVIWAYDDGGWRYEPVKLSLRAGESVQLSSDDLELGNEAKGLAGSTGQRAGDGRLEILSELDIQVLAYVYTPGGPLTTIHDVVPRSGRRHQVFTFNPGVNADQQSRLRIVNPGTRPAHVSIAGIDDGGNPSREIVRLSVPAGAARTLTSFELAFGGHGLRGRLGNGQGKWRLQVDCEQPIYVMNMLESPSGLLTNLSVGPSEF